jgi:hypothetical protein
MNVSGNAREIQTGWTGEAGSRKAIYSLAD